VLEKGAELVHFVVFLLLPLFHPDISSLHRPFGEALGVPPRSSNICSIRVLVGSSLGNLLACSIMHRRLLSRSPLSPIPPMFIFVLSNLVTGSLLKSVVWLSA
jgi:hypothetical protein